MEDYLTAVPYRISTALKVVEKQWGIEIWRKNDEDYCIKWLVLTPGWRCSEHYHPMKKETFIVMHGACTVSLDGKEVLAIPGDQFEIEPMMRHWFGVESGEPCTLLEVSTFHSDEDVVRLSPSGPYERRAA